MKQYLDLLKKVYEDGTDKPNRTGIDTRSIFGAQMRFDLSKGFPLVTTKKVHFIGGISLEVFHWTDVQAFQRNAHIHTE